MIASDPAQVEAEKVKDKSEEGDMVKIEASMQDPLYWLDKNSAP